MSWTKASFWSSYIFSDLKTSSNFRSIKHIYVEDLDWRSSQVNITPTSIEMNKNQSAVQLFVLSNEAIVSFAIIVLQFQFAIAVDV